MLEGALGGSVRDEYRQNNSLGSAHCHWRRARIGRRFRLFFRYDSKARVIVCVFHSNDADQPVQQHDRSKGCLPGTAIPHFREHEVEGAIQCSKPILWLWVEAEHLPT